MLQISLQFLPKNIQLINQHVAMLENDDEVIFYTASGPFFSYATNDRYGKRLAQAVIVTQTTVNASQLAKAMKINRSTVTRNVELFKESGPSALIIDKSIRKSSKLNDDKRKEVQKLLNQGCSVLKAASEVGVTEGCIRYQIKMGRINRQQDQTENNLKTPSQRSKEDQQCSLGIGTKRTCERTFARKGLLEQAEPQFSNNESVQYAGALIALPIMSCIGFIDACKDIYGKIRNGFYGLQSIFLTLAFMGFLRIKTPEQLKNASPGDMGIILGLDRAPEVKTLRRKLTEIGVQQKAGEFMTFLSRRWTEFDRETLGYIYVDGHVRPYHGRKYKIPKTHVARRRLCMSATTDFWVNDTNCEPLFFITSEANDSLLSTVENDIIPELLSLKKDDERPTIIFDREGWSPNSFKQWSDKGIDVITYRKGKYEPWPDDCFIEFESSVRGKKVKYSLGERSIKIKKDFWVREVRRQCENGHQTSIITTRQDLYIEEIARRMFFRWNQENYFRYMREEYGLDHLVTNDVEGADAERFVPNPEKKEKNKQKIKLKKQLDKLKAEYGQKAVINSESKCPTMRGFNISNAGDKKEIIELEYELRKLSDEIKQMPEKVALKDIMPKNEIVRLETERKRLTDTVKMTCYRAETALVNLIQPYFSRNYDEGRSFIKTLFHHKADLFTDSENKTLRVKFHTMSNPRFNLVLQNLCKEISEMNYCYPGTDMMLIFETTLLHH